MKKGSKRKQLTAILSVIVLTCGSLAGCGSPVTESTPEQSGFAPSLDTNQTVSLEISGFMGNFEALDQVINDFNAYYPNVSINYEQNDINGLPDYLKNNSYVDIFMTSNTNFQPESKADICVLDNCLDLSAEKIDTSAIDPELLEGCTVDGKLTRIPLSVTMCGMVVNKTLLAKEGLEIPQTYGDFLSVCETLKSKGYIPIQSSQYHAYSDMVLPMAMSILGNDKELTVKIDEGDSSYADSLLPVYQHLQEIIDLGYTSLELNQTYPDGNYEEAILKFFEGDVPFWIANTESVSGMKKRESKSEAFSANPFEYEFVSVPLSEDGVYTYKEPWYGFSVNGNGEQVDYAVEFIRFLVQEEELNKLAFIKGMPSVTLHNDDTRYNNALNPQKEAGHYTYGGKLDVDLTAYIADTANAMGRGDYPDAESAIEAIKEK